MSNWNNDCAYPPPYAEYYQPPVPGATPRSNYRSSQKYSDFQYANLERSQQGYEQNPPYAQGQTMASNFDNSLSKSSTNAYGNRYFAPAVAPNHHHAVDQKRNQQNADPHTGIKKSRSEYPQIAIKPSDSTAQVPSEQPTGYVAKTSAHGQTSGSPMKDIGTVCYNEDTQEYRYKCDREGCTRKSMGRVQDLKRHFDDFHAGLLLECPVAGCDHTRARRDKLMKHCREAHGIEYGY